MDIIYRVKISLLDAKGLMSERKNLFMLSLYMKTFLIILLMKPLERVLSIVADKEKRYKKLSEDMYGLNHLEDILIWP